MSKSKKLVFFGSGPVSRASLEALYKKGFDFEAVITKPRLAHHRGPVPVLDFVEKNKVPYYTPQNKQEVADLFSKQKFTSPMGLVVDYGIIISKDVIDSFPKGILNSHFSLLPEWRGADPITFAILSGQTETGVSLMLINKNLDEGMLISQEKLPIKSDYDAPELTQKLVELSSKMLNRDMPPYLDCKINPYPQPDQTPTYSRKLVKEDGILDWAKPAEQLEREVRAYAGWPRSVTRLFGHKIIVTKARVAKQPASQEKDDALIMRANPGWLEITELIAPSGRKMSGADFLRGYRN